VLSCVLTYMRS